MSNFSCCFCEWFGSRWLSKSPERFSVYCGFFYIALFAHFLYYIRSWCKLNIDRQTQGRFRSKWYVCLPVKNCNDISKVFLVESSQSLPISNKKRGENAFEVHLPRFGIWATVLWCSTYFFFYKTLHKCSTNIANPLCQFMQHSSLECIHKRNINQIWKAKFCQHDTNGWVAEPMTNHSVAPLFNWQPRSAPLVRGLAAAYYRYLNTSARFSQWTF